MKKKILKCYNNYHFMNRKKYIKYHNNNFSIYPVITVMLLLLNNTQEDIKEV